MINFKRGKDKKPRKKRRLESYVYGGALIGGSIGSIRGSHSAKKYYSKSSKSRKSLQTQVLQREYINKVESRKRDLKRLIELENKLNLPEKQERVLNVVKSYTNEVKNSQANKRNLLNKQNRLSRKATVSYGASKGLAKGITVGAALGIGAYSVNRLLSNRDSKR